ncbi:hypothetical protein Taro_033693, partial [Colocasia esculenta]|nr:hypothetical protein [Colocasia esculenta]
PFREGIVEDVSDDVEEPSINSGGKRKSVASRISLLTRNTYHKSKKKRVHVHMKLVINRLNAHEEILCSLQYEVQSIFLSQSTDAKEIGVVKVELKKMRSTNTFCKGGVDTPHNGVDTIPQTQRQKAEEMLNCVDTSQKAGRHESQIPGIRLLRSTLIRIRSTLDLVPRTICLQNGTGGRRRMKVGRHCIISQNSLFSEVGQEVDTTTRAGTNTFCKGGVDTPHNGVDKIPQTQWQKAEEMLRLCRHERSTQDVGRSTLDHFPEQPVFRIGTGGRHHH